MKAKKYSWLLAVAAALSMAGCTIVLTNDVTGTASSSGGISDAMLQILEEELNAAYSASGSRALAGGSNSIKHGLPTTTVAKVREKVAALIADSGLAKSRDLARVGPAMAKATATALADPAVSGTVAASDKAQVNALAAKALAKSMHAPKIASVADGASTEADKELTLASIAKASADNMTALGLTGADAGDSLQKMVLVMLAAGSVDVAAGADATASAASDALLKARAGSLVEIACARLDGLATSTTCIDALNGIANAALLGLGETAVSSNGLSAIVQDGVLAKLLGSFYKYKNDCQVAPGTLLSSLSFSSAMGILNAANNALAAKVQEIQSNVTTLVAAANGAAVKTVLLAQTGSSGNLLANATAAANVAALAVTTWTSGSAIRVGGNITVNGSLIIEPGVTVFADSGCYITVSSTGSITSEGSAGSSISFTKSGSANWGGIRVNSMANSFKYCEFSNASIAVEVAYGSGDQGAASFENCVFHDNASQGIEAADAKAGTSVATCWFYANGSYPVIINQNVSLDGSNHFYKPDAGTPDPAAKYNTIGFSGGVSKALTLAATEVPYYISANVTVSGARLTIGEGAILKFASGCKLTVNEDAQIFAGAQSPAAGSTPAHAIFTSYGDGSVGGDTNGLGSTGSPGQWAGIDIKAPGCSLNYCEIRFATTGLNFNSGVNDSLGAASIANSRFRGCSVNGVNAYKAAAGTTIASCYFYAHNSFPVVIRDIVALDATNHFYDPTGTSQAPDPAAKYNAIQFYGNIGTGTTFGISEIPYYRDGNITVSSGAKLTLAAGAVVKFTFDSGLSVSQGAQFDASAGTVDRPIVFTSYNDGSIGGDTNGFTNSVAAAGDWTGLDLKNSGCKLTYCELRYAKTGLVFNSGVNDSMGSATIANCRFRNCSVYGLDAYKANTGTSVVSSYFYANASYPVRMNCNVALDSTNHFYDPSGTVQAPDLTAKYNAISFYGAVNSALSFGVSEIPYYIPSRLDVNASPGSLVISPGAILKFENAIGMRVLAGGLLNATGTLASPITFTSVKDDTVGGDTDGVATTAFAGDWLSLDIKSRSNVLEYCRFTYGTTPIFFNSGVNDSQGAASISNCAITKNSQGGIAAVKADTGTTISTCSITGNNAAAAGPYYDIDRNGNANVALSGNTIDFMRN